MSDEKAKFMETSSVTATLGLPAVCLLALEKLRDTKVGTHGSRVSYGITRGLDMKIRCLLGLSTFRLGLLGR